MSKHSNEHGLFLRYECFFFDESLKASQISNYLNEMDRSNMTKWLSFFCGKYLTGSCHIRKTFAVLTCTSLVLTGTGAPSIAQIKQSTPIPIKVFQEQNPSKTEESFFNLTAPAGSSSDLLAEANKMLAEETSQWTQQDKNTLKALMALDLAPNYLKELATLPADELQNQIKYDPKLAQVSTSLQLNSDNTKILAVALVASHIAAILKSFWAGVRNGTIRSTPNLRISSLFSSLARGDIRRFRNLLYQAFPDATAFVEAMSTGAAFACNAATLQLGARELCPRFSSFARGIARRVANLRSSNATFEVASIDVITRQKLKGRNRAVLQKNA